MNPFDWSFRARFLAGFLACAALLAYAIYTQVKAGDSIALSEKAQKQLRVQEALAIAEQHDLTPSWIEVDAKKFSGVFKAVPDRADLPADINEALIVELYSK